MKSYKDIINQWNDVKNAYSDLFHSLKNNKEIQVNDILSKVPFGENFLIEFDTEQGRATIVDGKGELQYYIKLSFWLPSLFAYLYDKDKKFVGKVRRRLLVFPNIEDYIFDGCRQYEKYTVFYRKRKIDIVSFVKKKSKQRFYVPQENKGILIGDTVGFSYDFVLDNSSKAKIYKLTQRLKEIMIRKYIVSCDDINEEIILLYMICVHFSVIK